MPDRNAGGKRGPQRGGPGGKPKPKPKPIGGLRLQRLDGREFALDHPKCIHEMELDYAEGLELRREGDSEGARDALRYALQGCGDNMWVHVALGLIALEEFNDPSLARGATSATPSSWPSGRSRATSRASSPASTRPTAHSTTPSTA